MAARLQEINRNPEDPGRRRFPSGIHPAWRVCLGCALLFFCTTGLIANANVAYQPYILSLNGFTNAQTSTLMTIRDLSAFGAAFLTSRYYRRLSLRTGMALAGLFAAASMAGFGLSRSYPAYCAASFLSGMGFGFGSMIPIAILLGRWFHRRRTLAVSLCHASSGIATLGIPSLIASSVENCGLPVTFFGEGLLICALTALSFLLVRDRPDGILTFPYGQDSGPEPEPPSGKRSGIGGTDWFLIVPALLMTGAVTSVGFGHLSMLAASNGFTERTAALVVTVAGLMLMIGKAGFGVLSERYTTFRANRVFSAVLLISLAAFSFPIRSTALLLLSTALYGAGISMTAVGISVWAGDLSAEQDYDRNVRRFQVAYSAGCLLFASVPGILADAAGGSYLPAFRMLLAFAACSMLIVQFLYRACRKRSR